jgi:hypothetical protein
MPLVRGLGTQAPEGTDEQMYAEILDAIVAIEAKLGTTATTQMVQIKNTQLTAAQVNDLKDTQITVVPAPAAGFAVIPLWVHMFLDHGGADFVQNAGTDQIALRYVASTEIAELGTATQMTAFIEASADAILYVPLGDLRAAEVLASVGLVPVTDVGLELDNNGATDFTTGTGTLSVRVGYITVPMAAFS